MPRFQMRVEGDGHPDTPSVRLVMDEAGERQDATERVFEALATLGPVDQPRDGHPGASVASLVAALKCSEVTVRRALKTLQEDGRTEVVGRAAKGKALWGLVDQGSMTKQEGAA
jgi:hypothetical protein